MRVPQDHPHRLQLYDEAHARPAEALVAPLRLSYLALVCDEARGEQAARMVDDLARRFGAPPPPPGANHYRADLGAFRLKWERHTEFTRYKFIAPDGVGDPFAEPALSAVPADWLAALPGQLTVATHVVLERAGDAPPDLDRIAGQWFGGNALVGAAIAGGAALAVTDYRIHGDGFGRLLVRDHAMTPGQAGRMIQRLLELDTYRLLALLALPVARELAPPLSGCERELARITAALMSVRETDEPLLLEQLTRLAAGIENRQSDNLYRFSAAAAYYELVRRRIAELREERIQGLQTFQEFIERRLAPAMNTCDWVVARQDSLSQRVARATRLLSIRVAITQERQTQAVLESMNRRARLQLRLQETVEGLSVAAVTYYVVGLVGYAAKALRQVGIDIDPELVMGISIPIVALLTALGVRRIRRMVARST